MMMKNSSNKLFHSEIIRVSFVGKEVKSQKHKQLQKSRQKRFTLVFEGKGKIAVWSICTFPLCSCFVLKLSHWCSCASVCPFPLEWCLVFCACRCSFLCGGLHCGVHTRSHQSAEVQGGSEFTTGVWVVVRRDGPTSILTGSQRWTNSSHIYRTFVHVIAQRWKGSHKEKPNQTLQRKLDWDELKGRSSFTCVCSRVCVCLCVYVCVRACVCERVRERKRQRDRERGKFTPFVSEASFNACLCISPILCGSCLCHGLLLICSPVVQLRGTDN